MNMQAQREGFRSLVSGHDCTMAAPIFDPLSARIAEMAGWSVCKLSGSVAKASALGLPDDVALSNMTDTVDICRRILSVADVSLIVDADDGGAGPLSVRRAVRELEAVGVAAIEIDDNAAPSGYGGSQSRHSAVIPVADQVAKLRAAVAARRDPLTVIVARTCALQQLEADEAVVRIAAYAAAGVDAVMLPGLPSAIARSSVMMVHEAAGLPLFVLGLPVDVVADSAFLDKNEVRIQYLPQLPYRMAVAAIGGAFERLKAGGDLGLDGADVASSAVQAEITRTRELAEWERAHHDR